jgi:hypothetical protein
MLVEYLKLKKSGLFLSFKLKETPQLQCSTLIDLGYWGVSLISIHAVNYLDITTTFQSFNDNKNQPSNLSAAIFAKENKNNKELVANLQKAGHGIYWCVNPQIDHNKRSIVNTKEWICVGLDCDMFNQKEIINISDEELIEAKKIFLEKVKTWEVQPTGLIESHKGFYPYWIFNYPIPITDPEEVNLNYRDFVKKLGDKIGYPSEGDNIARVLRVPGSYHLKNPNKPFLIKELIKNGNVIDREELAQWIGYDTWIKREEREIVNMDRHYESIYDVPIINALKMLSGTALVNFEVYEFQKTGSGNYNIIINGKLSSNYINPQTNSIGKTGGGATPNIVDWVMWYTEEGYTKMNKESVRTALDGILLGSSFEVRSWNDLSTEVSDLETNLWTMEKILAVEVPKDRYLVQDLIPRGCVFLSGPPKSMKSFVSMHLTACLSSGRKLFGRFDVPQKRNVLVLDRENAIWSIKDRIQMLNMQDTNVSYLTVRDSFSNENFRQKFLKFIKEKGFDVIILDSFRRFFSGNENDSTEVSQFFLFLDRIKDLDISVICIHHFNKNSEAKGSNKLRGSGDIVAYFDANINFEKVLDAGVISLEIEQTDNRHNTEVQKFKTNIIIDEDNNMSFNFVDFIDEEASIAEKTKIAVLKLLKEKDIAITRNDIIKKLIKDHGGRNISDAITKLFKDHKIIKIKEGKFVFYKYGTDLYNEGGEE